LHRWVAQPRAERPAPRLSDAQLAKVEQVLLMGPTATGFVGELWILERIALVIGRLTGIQHHPAHVWALLRHRLGWTVRRLASLRWLALLGRPRTRLQPDSC
jgi:transposase